MDTLNSSLKILRQKKREKIKKRIFKALIVLVVLIFTTALGFGSGILYDKLTKGKDKILPGKIGHMMTEMADKIG